jgi:CHASE2 domain-containing sensor protein
LWLTQLPKQIYQQYLHSVMQSRMQAQAWEQAQTLSLLAVLWALTLLAVLWALTLLAA